MSQKFVGKAWIIKIIDSDVQKSNEPNPIQIYSQLKIDSNLLSRPTNSKRMIFEDYLRFWTGKWVSNYNVIQNY